MRSDTQGQVIVRSGMLGDRNPQSNRQESNGKCAEIQRSSAPRVFRCLAVNFKAAHSGAAD